MERALALYQRWISPPLHALSRAIHPLGSGAPGACRFQPTCSAYAATAIVTHGLLRGAALSAWRLLRCHPFSRGGFDPVPVRVAPPSVYQSVGPALGGTDQPRHLP